MVVEKTQASRKRLSTARELYEAWVDLKDDGEVNVALRRRDDGDDEWSAVEESGDVGESLKNGEPGLYCIWDVEESKPLMKARIVEGGLRNHTPRFSPSEAAAKDAIKAYSGAQDRLVDSWERMAQFNENAYRDAVKRNVEKDREIAALNTKIAELSIELAEKSEGLENDMPDLIKYGIDAFTGRQVNFMVRKVAERVLSRVPEEQRPVLGALIIQSAQEVVGEESRLLKAAKEETS